MASDSVKPITSRARVIWTAISVPVATIASVIGCFALAAVSQQVFFTVPYYVQYDYSQFFALSMLEYLTIFGVVPYVVAAGYWFSLRRMPGMSWWRITLSIAAINAVQMFVILPLGVTLQYALFPPYQPASGAFILNPTPASIGAIWGVFGYFPLAFALFLGVGIMLAFASVGLARLFARWRFVPTHQPSAPLVRDLLLIGGIVSLLVFLVPMLIYLVPRWLYGENGMSNPLTATLGIIINLSQYLAPAIFMTIVASAQRWRALRRMAPVAPFRPSPMPPSSDDVVFTYGAIGSDD